MFRPSVIFRRNSTTFRDEQGRFHDLTYHLDPVFSASQPHGSGTNSLSAFVKPSHFLLLNVISRHFFQSAYHTP